VIQKIVPEAGYVHKYLRKSTNSREVNMEIDQWQIRKDRKEILVQLSEKYLELISVFKEASRNFIFTFIFKKAASNIRNQLRMH
jgi:hypothetical protein